MRKKLHLLMSPFTKKACSFLLIAFVGMFLGQNLVGQACGATIEPISPPAGAPTDADGNFTVCSDGSDSDAYTQAEPPVCSLPDSEYAVEVNDELLSISPDGAFDATGLMPGDEIRVTGFTYDLVAINELLTTAAQLCPLIDCDGSFGIEGINMSVIDLVEGNNEGSEEPGLESLQEAITFAGSFGSDVASVDSAVATLNGLNELIGGLLGEICFNVSEPYEITVIECGGGTTGGVCDPTPGEDPAIIEDIAVPEGAPVNADGDNIVCGDNSSAYEQAEPPTSSLPDNDYVIEFNGSIVDINANSAFDASDLSDGDEVCITGFAYDLVAINDLLETACQLCPLIDCDGSFGIEGINQGVADLCEGNNDGEPGLNNLQEAITFAGSFGSDVASVDSAVTTLNGLNDLIGGLLGYICFATSNTYCITAECGGAAGAINDECDNAIALSLSDDETLVNNGPFDHTGATVADDDPEIGADCFAEDQFGEEPFVNNTVWYTFVGDGQTHLIYTSQNCADGPIADDEYFTDGDTQMALYTGGCGDYALVDCNEDDNADLSGEYDPNGNWLSSLVVPTVDGETYYLLVDGFNVPPVSEGAYCINTQVFVAPEPVCDDAVWVDDSGPELSDVPIFVCGTESGLTGLDTMLVAIAAINGTNTFEYDISGNVGFPLVTPLQSGFFTYYAITQDDIDASGGSLTITLTGIDDAVGCDLELVADLSGVEVCTDGGGECDVVAGTISTNDPTTFCVGNDDPDIVNVAVEGNTGTNYTYIVTNEDGTEILAGPNDSGNFDFNLAGAGNCIIWGIAHDGTLDIPTEFVADITGCFELSNPIPVIRIDSDDPECMDCPDPLTGNTDICAGNTEVWNMETCEYELDVVQVLGCTDPNADNFDANANCDDGSCVIEPGLEGCTDPDACNYDPNAETDNGSCILVLGGTISTSDATTVCVGDGTGDVINVSVSGNVGSDYAYIVTDGTATTILSGPSTDGVFDFDAAPAGTCLIWGVAHDGSISIPTTAVADITGCFALSNSIEVIREDCVIDIFGCTDPIANNYNPEATQDDGSCTYNLGCTDPDACNYDANATQDDGSCTTVEVVADYDCDTFTGVATIVFTFTGGTGSYNVSGDVNGTFNQGENITITIEGDAPTVSVTAIDGNGCSDTFTQSYSACTKTPLELLSFDGRAENKGNFLTWTTASELNTDFFAVQRSIDGVNFTTIDKITAAGNSNTMITYDFIDTEANLGTSTYRLEMFDIDGTSKLSNSIAINRRGFGEITIAPVPAEDYINVSFNATQDTKTTLEVINIAGKVLDVVVTDSAEGFNQIKLDVSQYSKGLYFINITNGIETVTERFIK